MGKRIIKYFNKFYFALIDFIFRRKSLNTILWILVIFTISEMTAYGIGDELADLITELKEKYPEGIRYWGLRIIETIYVDGNVFLIITSIVLIIVFAYLKTTRNCTFCFRREL